MEMRGLTCFVFQYDVPPVPLCISGRLFVYLIPGDEGFVSVWVMDAGVIRSFWARDSIWPQNAYLQVDDMRELCRQPVRYDTLHRETSIFQRQRIIYISTPNLTGRVVN